MKIYPNKPGPAYSGDTESEQYIRRLLRSKVTRGQALLFRKLCFILTLANLMLLCYILTSL